MPDIGAIQNRLNAVRPGWEACWIHHESDGGLCLCGWVLCDIEGELAQTIVVVPNTPAHERMHAAKDLMVFAPTDIAALLAYIEELEARMTAHEDYAIERGLY